jgi:Zn-dependent protease
MSHFYEIDSTRVSHKEYWWGTRSPFVLIGWILKWLRIRIPSSSDDPNVDSTLPHCVQSLPNDVSLSFQPLMGELVELGFHSPVFHLIYDPGTQTTVHWATFLHSPGSCCARIHNRRWEKAPKSSRALFAVLFTGFNDGTFLVSSSGKPDMDAPASVVMNRMPRSKAAELWNAHLQRMGDLSQQKQPNPVRTREELLASSEQLHIQLRDFHLDRGVFRARSTEENTQAEAFRTRIEEARAQGLEHGEVLAELDRLRDQKAGWAGTVWILVFSVIAFIAAGAARWDWKFTLLLVPILFFHEAGHWLAMKTFRYRNVRMFFIPLFGAAVTGRNWNVAGWKKALVSLAGPLPGIALGVGLGTAGMILEKSWLTEAAVLLIVLNGFNLLPMLPLDGGHVLHSTLFCRNRWLDIVFRVLAILGFISMGIFGGVKVLPYLAIPMAIALPLAFKMGKITDELRRSSLPLPLPNQNHIPTPTAQAIISAVKSALPNGSSSKTVATHSLAVFETLNARPPGVWATLGLLLLHGGGVLVTLAFGALLIVHNSGGIGDFFNAAAKRPQHLADCEQIRLHEASPEDSQQNMNTIVTTLATAIMAEKSFAELTNQIPAGGRLLLFGESLLLACPADDEIREKWFDEFQSRSTNTFVALSNRPITISLTFLAPDELAATNIELELRDYLDVGGAFQLLPPWSAEAEKPEFTEFRTARRQWLNIPAQMNVIWEDKGLREMNRKIGAAARRGAAAESDRLNQERQELMQDLQRMTLEVLRSAETNNPALLDLYAAMEATPYTNRTEHARLVRQVAAHLGTAVDCNNSPDRADPRGTATGSVSRHGLLVAVHWASFNDVTSGLPTFAQWLCRKGCEDLRYSLDSGFYFNDGGNSGD